MQKYSIQHHCRRMTTKAKIYSSNFTKLAKALSLVFRYSCSFPFTSKPSLKIQYYIEYWMKNSLRKIRPFDFFTRFELPTPGNEISSVLTFPSCCFLLFFFSNDTSANLHFKLSFRAFITR